eukprot:7241695-Lingulodinium_polyedra.AAC.1
MKPGLELFNLREVARSLGRVNLLAPGIPPDGQDVPRLVLPVHLCPVFRGLVNLFGQENAH